MERAPLLEHPFTWTLDGRAEISDFLAWVALRRGRYWPCWVPTWRQELVLAAPAGSGDTELTIVATSATRRRSSPPRRAGTLRSSPRPPA
jgi:hypothetical protein